MRHAGFFSERTAEYALVPDLIRRLSGLGYSSLVPFAFASNREGQAKAREGFAETSRVLAGYACRPRVREPGDGTGVFKVHEEVFAHATRLAGVGIRTLVGVPCVSRLMDLRINSACVWYVVAPGGEGRGDVVVPITLREESPCQEMVAGAGSGTFISVVHGPLGDAELDAVLQEGAALSWADALRQIAVAWQDLRSTTDRPRTPFGPLLRDRPFYVAALKAV